MCISSIIAPVSDKEQWIGMFSVVASVETKTARFPVMTTWTKRQIQHDLASVQPRENKPDA